MEHMACQCLAGADPRGCLAGEMLLLVRCKACCSSVLISCKSALQEKKVRTSLVSLWGWDSLNFHFKIMSDF